MAARVAAAGFTGREWDGVFCLYLYDARSGRLLARLSGLAAPVQHLAFSADGLRLAAALGGRAGIKVWEARNGRLAFEDAGYGGPARMLAFDRDGRLATSSADGHVRVYDPAGRKLADKVPLPGARPFGLAWSPDAALLALGYEDRLRVEVLAAGDLRSVMLPDPAGLVGEGLPAVAWAADGRGGVQLYAAGYARLAGASPPTAAVARGIAVQRGEASARNRPRAANSWCGAGATSAWARPRTSRRPGTPSPICWRCRAVASPMRRPIPAGGGSRPKGHWPSRPGHQGRISV